MPNRILKQTICTSPNLNAVSMGAENFFYRLIVQCDDFGRYHATPSILRGHCYPLKIDEVSNDNIAGWVDELRQADILIVYDGGRYLQLTNWAKHQTKRADKSKFPDPQPDEIICKQLQADESNGKQILTYSRTGTGTGTGCEEQAADAATAGNPPSAPEAKKAETHHPALVVYRDVYDKWPSKPVWETIISAVGESPAGLKLYREVLKDWALCNYSPVNFAGQLDWFKAGGKPARQPARSRQNGRATVADAFDLVDQIAAERAAMGGTN